MFQGRSIVSVPSVSDTDVEGLSSPSPLSPVRACSRGVAALITAAA